MECEISCRSEQERLKLRLKQSQKQKQLQPDNRKYLPFIFSFEIMRLFELNAGIEYAMVNSESDPELVLYEHDQHKTFMFAQSNAFIQLDGKIIDIFQLRSFFGWYGFFVLTNILGTGSDR